MARVYLLQIILLRIYIIYCFPWVFHRNFMGITLSVILHYLLFSTGFPVAQMLKTLPGNAGDPSSIPGLGRSAREWISYPVQYSWASLVAQLVKNLSAMQETWVQSPGQEDPLEKKLAIHPVFLPGKSHGQMRLVGYSPWGRKESDMTE